MARMSGRPHVVPSFVLGVTGHMDIPDADREAIQSRLVRVFEWLRAPASQTFADVGASSAGELRGLGLQDTPIVVLSSLAPGADSLVAEVALDLGKTITLADGVTPAITVRAPLPFPPQIYREATTFRREGEPAETERQRAFDRLLKRIPAADVFPVLTRDDWPADPATAVPSESEMLARFRDDVADQSRRRLRYRTAGEYIAGYCDLLVALWDGDESDAGEAGTAAIVTRRREGLTPGLLPLASSFRWATTGAVLHLPIASRGGSMGANSVSKPVGTGRMLYPLPPFPKPRADAADPDRWPERYDQMFYARVRCLERFHADWSAMDEPPSLETDEVRKLLGRDARQPDANGDTLAEDLQHSLGALARLRACAAILASRYDTSRQAMMRQLCWMILAAAVLLHLYAHWHPGGPDEHPALSSGFLGGAIAMAVWAGLLFSRYDRRSIEARRYDYRALCEGVRVQFYWNVAGVGRSAASHYMQRQRNEMDWIRSALASLSFPYQRWSGAFHDLSPLGQCQALTSITRNWIRGQWEYYKSRSVRASGFHEMSHALGWGTALGGLIHLGLLLVWRVIEHIRFAQPIFIGSATLAAAGYYVWRRLELRHEPSHYSREVRDGRWWPLMFDLFPHPKRDQVAAAIVALTLPLPFLLSRIPRGMPPLEDLWFIVLGIVIASGAIVIAWGEKSLYAEHSRQYESMQHLFGAACRQMEDCVRDIERTMTSDPHAMAEHVVRAQRLIFDLGKEALDEHAEWLILHRARPLEPFLAG